MAEQTQGSITIAAPPSAVMAVIADFEAYPEWAQAVRRASVVETGPDGRGTKVEFEIASGPIKAQYTLAYEYAGGDAGCSWTFVEGNTIRDLEGSYELAAADGGTEVTYRVRMDLAIPMPGFMKRQGERMLIDTALKGLKKRVESLG